MYYLLRDKQSTKIYPLSSYLSSLDLFQIDKSYNSQTQFLAERKKIY